MEQEVVTARAETTETAKVTATAITRNHAAVTKVTKSASAKAQ